MRAIRKIIVILLLSGCGLAGAGWEEASTAFQQGDYSTAMSEYYALAERGDPKAQNNLGTMYDLGQGAPQNHKEAAKWFRKAALQGLAGAQFNLGWMYWKGQGVVQDYIQAHMWFNIAGANGDDDALESRDSISQQMTKAQIAEAQKRAREWMVLHP